MKRISRPRFWMLTLFSLLSLAAYAINDSRYAMLREMADSLHNAGNSDSAAIVAREALAIAEKGKDPTAIMGAHSSLGVYLRSQGKIDEALEHYRAGMEIVTSTPFRESADEEALEEASSIYINVAILLLDTANKEEAGMSWSEIPDDCSLGVYRILQEAVSNALRHSGASEIAVSLLLADNRLSLKIAGNGCRAIPPDP